jgi:hypothetical protein
MNAGGQTTECNPWYALGTKAHEFGIHSEGLESRLERFDPEQARSILLGYVDALIPSDALRAHRLLLSTTSTARLSSAERNARLETALIQMVNTEFPEKELCDPREDTQYSRMMSIVWNHIKEGAKGLYEVAKAAEKNNPPVAAMIYSNLGKMDEFARLTREAFKRNPYEAAELMAKYAEGCMSDLRKELLDRLVSRRNLHPNEWDLAFKMANDYEKIAGDVNWTATRSVMPGIYSRIAEGAMKSSAFTAYYAAQKSDDKKLEERAKINLIMREGPRDHSKVRALFEERTSDIRGRKVTDAAAMKELGLTLAEAASRAPKSDRFWLCVHALEILNAAEYYEGRERTACAVKILLEQDERSSRHGSNINYHMTDNDLIEAGLELAHKHPEIAYKILVPAASGKNEKAQAEMPFLSDRLERRGKTGEAYLAELNSAEPRQKRVERLRQKLAGKEIDRFPHWPYEFDSTKDTAGKLLWYKLHSEEMGLPDRYKCALRLSQETGEESSVDQLRQELLSKDTQRALHEFRFANDTKGVEMIREKVAGQIHADEAMNQTIIDFLSIKTRDREKEEEEARKLTANR